MSEKKTRYFCNWDCSNQGKFYTVRERQFMRQAVGKGKSITYMAKKLKRGYWAIQVQVNGYGVVSSSSRSGNFFGKRKQRQHRQPHPLSRAKPRYERVVRSNAHRQRRCKRRSKEFGIKQCGQLNRVFEGKQEVVKTEGDELEKELKEMMGL